MFHAKYVLNLSVLMVAMLAQEAASAAEWQVRSATVELGYRADIVMTTPGKPFVDGQFSSPPPWPEYEYQAVSSRVPGRNYEWLGGGAVGMLDFLAFAGDPYHSPAKPPVIDLANMRADFSSVHLKILYFGGYAGHGGFSNHTEYDDSVGSDGWVSLTQNANGSYTARWPTFNSTTDYWVTLNFISVPDGSAANYVPVPEASTMFMALAGLGALGLLRRRQPA